MLSIDPTQFDLEPALTQFATQGFARLGVVMDDVFLTTLQDKCNQIMLGDHHCTDLFFQHDSKSGNYADLRYGEGWIGPSLAYRKIEGLQHDPDYLQWINNALFQRLADALIGPQVTLYRAVLWNKAALAGTHLPWHQDDGNFWGIDRSPVLQVWTALDDAPEEAGCVEAVPGTHKDGLASAEGGTVQAEALETNDAEQRAIALPAKAGEAILIHNHLWHRSGRNTTPHARRAISVSYMDAATRCMRKRRAPRKFLPVFQH